MSTNLVLLSLYEVLHKQFSMVGPGTQLCPDRSLENTMYPFIYYINPLGKKFGRCWKAVVHIKVSKISLEELQKSSKSRKYHKFDLAVTIVEKYLHRNIILELNSQKDFPGKNLGRFFMLKVPVRFFSEQKYQHDSSWNKIQWK